MYSNLKTNFNNESQETVKLVLNTKQALDQLEKSNSSFEALVLPLEPVSMMKIVEAPLQPLINHNSMHSLISK